jgi:hypothetical protein
MVSGNNRQICFLFHLCSLWDQKKNISIKFSASIFYQTRLRSSFPRWLSWLKTEEAQRMMVFYKANLAFLSVPKTGTSAYESALRDHADLVISEPSLLKHAPVYRYNRFIRPMFLKVCDAELEITAVMREPISWLGSWWRYRQRDFMKGKPNATHGISFDDFVLAYMKGQKPDFADVGSQYNFLKRQPNGTGVTHLFRYEQPASLNKFLSDQLGIEFTLGRENESPVLPMKLSTNVESRFRRKFEHEFALYDSIPSD